MFSEGGLQQGGSVARLTERNTWPSPNPLLTSSPQSLTALRSSKKPLGNFQNIFSVRERGGKGRELGLPTAEAQRNVFSPTRCWSPSEAWSRVLVML